jgi:lipid II:glycine glycyltransferase (peptidoglycan interpeptide bridge formation enzyme)
LFNEANFLQSYNWGIFHQNLGKKVYRIGVYEGDTVLAISQLVLENAKRGNYFPKEQNRPNNLSAQGLIRIFKYRNIAT